jgi:hypothetical protein
VEEEPPPPEPVVAIQSEELVPGVTPVLEAMAR